MDDEEMFFHDAWDRLHPQDCECATCQSLALSATRAAAAAAKAAAKRPRAGPTAGRAPKRGFPTPATIGLAQVYGLSESDSPQFTLSDLPTCGEGGRTEMPEPPHQDGAAGAAERPPRGTAPGDSASGQTPMQTDDNDDEMDVDHRNSDSGMYTVRPSATHHSGSQRHHAASESRGPINIYEATAAEIINMGKEQLDNKTRRKRRKRGSGARPRLQSRWRKLEWRTRPRETRFGWLRWQETNHIDTAAAATGCSVRTRRGDGTPTFCL